MGFDVKYIMNLFSIFIVYGYLYYVNEIIINISENPIQYILLFSKIYPSKFNRVGNRNLVFTPKLLANTRSSIIKALLSYKI